MNIPTFAFTLAEVISTSVFNTVGSGFRRVAKSEILSTVTRGSQNTVTESIYNEAARFVGEECNCMGGATMVFTVSKIFFEHKMDYKLFLQRAAFIPLATRGLACLTRRVGHLENEVEILDKNLGKILNIATLVASVVLFPTLLYTASTIVQPSAYLFTGITGLIVGFDAYSLYKSS